jgi:hypothetical protein
VKKILKKKGVIEEPVEKCHFGAKERQKLQSQNHGII